MKNRLKELRETNGMSQEQLSIKSGIGRSTISEIEAGKHIPSVEVALLVSAAMGAKVEDIFILS